ncbi:MAG: dTDP-glucose 4,6-dehydratase [Candidatus Omnitrophota bacterium]
MRKRIPKILITGGAGFIGSHFVKEAVSKGFKVVVVDKLSYCADLKRLESIKGKYKFYKTDICKKLEIESIFAREKPDYVVNFAAESHVDRSIQSSGVCVKTNVLGTHVLLDCAKMYKVKKFIHTSTDEVYGQIEKGKFRETDSLQPRSPYSASKAAADCLVKSYVSTYNFPAIIVRPSNNYGPWQYPEKFMPVVIYKALAGERVPVYGRGKNKREWLYVLDCVKAISLILDKGKIGQIYNVGSREEKENKEVAEDVLKKIGKPENLIQFVKDRPGHDFRYSLNCDKIKKLGWKSNNTFNQGLDKTIGWYQGNQKWLNRKAKSLKSYWKKVYKP